ncbi:MAG TPA: hydrogenase maturation protease [Terriglobales bacterium]|nr:hydrogenase maturation protease [Terriglobales bacterium]
MNEWEWHALEDRSPVETSEVPGVDLKIGDRVRLRPHQGGDVMDIALTGQNATVEGLEQDYEGKIHVGVVLDSDPGRDLGWMRQPGHRFFFDPDEVEPLAAGEYHATAALVKPSILIAGIGNIFLGDDGFGVEVVKRLASGNLPNGVRVADFGIRGFDLTYALLDGYDTTILVDAYPHGETPGTVYVVEPDVEALDSGNGSQGVVETHGMNPMNVVRMAKAMNARLGKVLLVGCEPATFGGEEGQMGLSQPVEAAVDEAVKLIDRLVEKLVNQNGAGPSL